MSTSTPAPADRGEPSLFLSMPRECRHIVFRQVAAARKIKPRDTLRYWFEKQDIQDQIAEYRSKDPDANVTYVAGYNNRYNDEDELETDDGQEVDVGDEQDEDEDQEDEENE